MATYAELAALATDPVFVSRVSHAVAKFATYILNEPEASANHKARFRWASSAVLNPGAVATAIAPAVTMNADVDYGLNNVLDPALQVAVETTCALLLFN